MKKSRIKLMSASLLGLAFSTNTFAAENINLDDIVVVASRIPQSRESAIGDVTVIDAEEIQRAGQSTFIELMQRQAGVETSSNGGAGQVSSIFLRGTNSNQVVVLVDGMRIGSATTGSTAFANIPLAQIDRIEILRGPATSLYGQDAVGGVIQIFTKQGSGAPQFNAELGYGSYNTKTAVAGFRGSVENTNFALNVSSLATNGFSSLKTNTSIDKDNDGYRNLAISGAISHKIIEGHEIGIQLLSTVGHNDYDSGFNSFNNFDDTSALSYSVFSKNQLMSNWKSTLRIGEGVDDDKSQWATGVNSISKYKTKQKQLSWQNDVALPVGTLTLLYDRLEQKLVSNTTFNQTTRNTDGILVGYLADIGNQSLQADLRTDHSSQFGTNTTGSLGYGYKFTPNWRITGSYGTAFKAPTFNDLYYPDDGWGPYSDPNLKAEKSENFEGSLRYQNVHSDASATLYHNKIDNFIALNQAYFPINVNAKIQGITLAANQSWGDWRLKGSLDIQSPRNEVTGKILNRRANRHGTVNLSKAWGDWRISTEVMASSTRFNDANKTMRMGGYSIVNLAADYKIDASWSVQGRINNLLDKDYTLAYSGSTPYNTPGANLFVSLVWLSK
ncbi:MAG: TonB-dependent receptor [Methylotenera sp.]|nr:TonB-dependent receptor [Methylotenera sp.]MSP99494.1 TonB-dependent receptor [Methylotenera sp.]